MRTICNKIEDLSMSDTQPFKLVLSRVYAVERLLYLWVIVNFIVN
jgi:hypothetical protein